MLRRPVGGRHVIYEQVNRLIEARCGWPVRDSKSPDGPKLAFTPDGWRTFTRQVKSDTPTLG